MAQKNELSASEIEMQKDFRKFVWYVFTFILNLPIPTRIQYDICWYLQHGNRKRFIEAFRGLGKSYLTCIYAVWRLWKDPQLKIVVVSANEEKAGENAVFIWKIIETVPFLRHLLPSAGQRSSTMRFDVGPALPSPSPSVKCAGIFGQITGSRADILIPDDIEVPKNSETEAMREKLETRTQEFAAVAKTGDATEIIWLGTPQTAESIYRNLPSKGYDVRIWPARYPSQSKMDNYGGYLAPLLLEDLQRDPELSQSLSACGGQPTDPERFNEHELVDREAEYARSGFMLQFQLDTRLSDAEKHPLKLRDFIVHDCDPDVAPVKISWASGPQQEIKDPQFPNVGFDGDRFYRPMYVSPDFVPYTGSVMVIDPSGRGKDETGYCITRFLNGMVYVVAWGGLRDGYSEETMTFLAELSKTHRVARIKVESNFGDGMWTSLFRPISHKVYAVTLEEYKVTGQKEPRIIQALEAPMQQHRVVIDSQVLRMDLKSSPDEVKYRGAYQISHLSKERGSLRHDDRVEVLSEAVGHWTKQMAVDADKAEDAHKEKLREQQLNDFIKLATGGPGRHRNRRYVKHRNLVS